MEGINTTSLFDQTIDASNLPYKGGSVSSGITISASGTGIVTLPGDSNKIVPSQVITSNFRTLSLRSVKDRKQIIKENKKMLNDLNLYFINEFLGEFYLKYKILNFKQVFKYLERNKFLTPLVSKTIDRIEKYFADSIEDLTLEVKYDLEEDDRQGILYLDIRSKLNIKDAFCLLRKFQVEWFIPNLSSQIVLFNVDIA